MKDFEVSEGRLRTARQMLQIMLLLCEQSYTTKQLADRTGLEIRQVRRYIAGLERLNVPVYRFNVLGDGQGYVKWAVQEGWGKRVGMGL